SASWNSFSYQLPRLKEIGLAQYLSVLTNYVQTTMLRVMHSIVRSHIFPREWLAFPAEVRFAASRDGFRDPALLAFLEETKTTLSPELRAVSGQESRTREHELRLLAKKHRYIEWMVDQWMMVTDAVLSHTNLTTIPS